MSNFLTSFLWKGVELNDGNIYGIPLADQGLDDPNSSDATWAYSRTAQELAGDKELVKELFEAGSTAVEAV